MSRMNNDLISRSAVLQILYDVKDDDDTPKNYGTLLDIIRQIRELPVAFDKEKVMAELYKKYNKLTDIYNVDKKYDPYCASKFIMNAYKDAIEIVEKGGKTEDFVKFRQVYEKLK